MVTLHLVTHTHWDREWYRSFQHFRLRLIHLVDGLLDLLASDMDFKHFMLDGQTIVLDDYLHMRPENEAKLRRYVRNGRLIIGPFHILPDEFLVSPEATIRNLLEGDRTCRKFGPKMQVGYIPDPFGHIGQLPQILQGFNIQTACVQRGLSDERTEFWWESPDGSHVLMAYLRDGYGNAAGLPTSDPQKFIAEVRRLRDSLLPHSNSPRHLLLMHGTDHQEPPADTSTAIASAQGHLDGDKLVHSTLGEYLAAVQDSMKHEQIPTVRGELRDCKRSHLLPGVLSTRMWIKQRNRASELLLEKWAEPFSTFQEVVLSHNSSPFMLDKKSDILHQVWRLLMENHPHDSICGCSIDQVHDEMKVRFDQVDQVANEITRQSLETLASRINTTRGESSQLPPQSALVVFNPLSFPRTDVVDVEVESVTAFDLVDGRGNIIPYQKQGLGSQELIHLELTPKELQGLYTNVHDGRVMGMSILELKLERKEDTVLLEATVSEHRQPDPKAWRRGLSKIEEYIADPSIKSFRVRACSLDSNKITFTARDVPGIGWKTLFVQPRQGGAEAPAKIPPMARLFLPLARLPFFQKLASRPRKSRPPFRIENDLLVVEAGKDGCLKITEKSTGRVYSGMNQLLDGGDCGDEYNYCPPTGDHVVAPRLKDVSISRGPVQQTLTLKMELSVSKSLDGARRHARERVLMPITSVVTLTGGTPRVDIRTTVENHARDHRLRVHFPAPFTAGHAEHDGHFEIVERLIGLPAFDASWVEQPRPEVPQRVFTSVKNGNERLTIANRGLPEVEVLKNAAGNAEISLTLLRCVGWLSRDDFSNRKGHAGPFIETPGAQLPGEWTFDYSIILNQDSLPACQQAYGFEATFKAVATDIHPGMLNIGGSFLHATPQEFIVSAVKRSEDGRGWIVRGYNLTGREIQVALQPWRTFRRVAQTNLAEEQVKLLKTNKDGLIALLLRGHEIATVKFWD